MTQFFNKGTEKEKRRRFRSNAPSAEIVLWSRLRRKHIHGYKFRRQYSVGPFVLDFYCPALKLAVEIDGDSHFLADAVTQDKKRQDYIETFGIQFLRFTNEQVYRNLDDVLETIAAKALPDSSNSA